MKILKNDLINIIQQNLVEADSYSRKFGKRYDQTTELEKYVDVQENGICKYAIRMMGGSQTGINPDYRFANPRGIYCYPLTSKIYDQLIYDELPYVSKAEHIVVFELQRTDKWLDVNAQDKYPNWLDICRQMTENAQKMSGKIDQSQNIDFDLILSESEDEGKHWNLSDGAKIYDFGYILKHYFFEKVFLKYDSSGEEVYRNKQAVAWQKLLQSVGFIGIYDKGDKVLHSHEPTQLVALQVDALKRIKFYKTETFRKSKTPFVTSKNFENHLNNLSALKKIELASISKDPKVLIALSKDNSHYIRDALTRNPNTPPEVLMILVLMILSRDLSQYMKSAVALHPNVTPEVLMILAKDENDTIRTSVAANSKTPPELLQEMSKDPKISVRKAVASNQNTPIEVLEILGNNKNESVWVKASLSKNPKTPPKILMIFAEEQFESVREYVAENPNTPPEALMILAKDEKDENSTVRYNVAKNPNTPTEALMILAKDKHKPIRVYIASNQNTPIEVLVILVNDPMPWIRKIVEENPTYKKYIKTNKNLSEQWNRILGKRG